MTALRAVHRTAATILFLCLWQAQPSCDVWTLGVFLGGARTQQSSIFLSQPRLTTELNLSPVRYRSESLKPPLYYAWRLGFFPRAGRFGVEGEVIHLKVVLDTSRTARFEGTLQGGPVAATRPLSSLVERFSITHGVNLLLMNAVVRTAPEVTGRPRRLILNGRVGVGASVPHPESTIAGHALEHYEWGDFSAQFAAGVELRLGKRVYLSGEYKLTHTVQDVAVDQGSARTPLTSHHLATGIVVHVGTGRRVAASSGSPKRPESPHADGHAM
jgi:hypothetical protein